jgi:flavorubredoxin
MEFSLGFNGKDGGSRLRFGLRVHQAARDHCRETLQSKGFLVQLFDLTQMCYTKAAEAASSANVFLVGTPTLNRDATPPIWKFLSSLDAYAIAGKPVGVFGSFGWSGEAVPAIVGRLSLMKCKVQGEGFKANFKPSDAEIEGMKSYVDSVAEMVK